MPHKILIVDDEPQIVSTLSEYLEIEKYETVTSGSAEEALGILSVQPMDAVISDDWMTGMSGTDLLAIVRRDYPDIIRILLTGHAELSTAIKAINEGEIYRFFTKPCNFVDLAVTLRQAFQQKDLLIESRRLLQAYKQQNAVINQLERKYPGMTKLDRTKTGSIIIDDTPEDFDSFFKALRSEVARAENRPEDPK